MKKNNKNIKFIFYIIFLISFCIVYASEYDMFLSNDKKKNIILMLNLLKDKKIRGFLSVIAVCEGTKKDDGLNKAYLHEYQVPLLKQKVISDLTQYPNRLFKGKVRNRIVSGSASGKYQFIKKTWHKWERDYSQNDFYYTNNQAIESFFNVMNRYYDKAILSMYKNKESLLKYKFGPFWQDLYAIGELLQADAVKDIFNADYASLLNKTSLIWASIPYDETNSSRYDDFINKNNAKTYSYVMALCEKYIQ